MHKSKISEKFCMSSLAVALFIALIFVSLCVSVQAAFSLGEEYLEEDDEIGQ